MILKFIFTLLFYIQYLNSSENIIEDNKQLFNNEIQDNNSINNINVFLETPTIAPTPDSFVSYSPTLKPSVAPKTKKPTNKPSAPIPTQKPTEGIYLGHPDVHINTDDQQIIVAVLTLALFVFMAFEILSPEVLFLIALIIIMLCQILSLSETLSGFSNESMITIGTLFLVIGAVEKSHIVDYVARQTFGMVGSITLSKIRMFITCFSLSIFFNNTPLVAILLPVVKDWGRVRNVAASQLLIPLSYSVLAGSFVSMIGTSTNLTVQGLMQADRGYSFDFFAPAPIGIPLFAILLVYQVVLGNYLLPHHKSGLIRAVRDHVESLVAEVYVSPDSKFIGKNLQIMMNALGIAPSRVIKIRRRTTPRSEKELKTEQKERLVRDKSKRKELKKRDSSIIDRKYLKEFLPFWKTLPGDETKQNNENNNEDDDGNEEIDNNDNINDNENEEEDEISTTPNNKRDLSNQKYVAANVQDIDIEESNKLNVEFRDIVAPSAREILSPEDVVFISSAQDVVEKLMKSVAGESKGLYIVESNVLSLPGYGSEIVECIVSDTNPFLGKKVSEIATLFSERYKFGFITIRSKDWGNKDENSTVSPNEENKDQDSSSLITTNEKSEKDNNVDNNDASGIELNVVTNIEEGITLTDDVENETIQAKKTTTELFIERVTNQTVSEHVIQYGDLILCVANSEDIAKARSTNDFFVISTVGELPKPLDTWKALAVVIFLAMMILVATENISMCPAALTITCVFFMGGWVTFDEIPKLVNIRLLMLMGCSLSFARSMTKTGLAIRIAQSIYDSDPSPFESCLLIYAITLVITELISNNAAAALMYPIAVALADELEVSFIPFAMTVLIASTSCFMSPIGYQTHVMVWGPGGYKFKDFLIFGFIPDITYWIVGCALIVRIYPFDKYPDE